MWPLPDAAIRHTRAVAAGVLSLAALVLIVASTTSVVSAQGALFPSFLADPYGVYSSVTLSDWELTVPNLRFPARIVRFAETDIGHTERTFHDKVTSTLMAVDTTSSESFVPIIAEYEGVRLSFRAPLRRLGRQETLTFFVNYVAAGILHLWLALTVLATSPPGRSVLAYVLLSVGAFGFLTTFFDYHTRGTLTPVFHCSGAILITGFVLCAYYFPDKPRTNVRLWRLLVRFAVAVITVVAVGLVLAPGLSVDSLPLRIFVTAAMPASIFVLAISLGFRWRNGTSADRDTLRAMLPGFLLGPAATALGFPLTLAMGGSAFHIALPGASLMMTGSLGMALVRTNVFRTTAVVRGAVLVLPALLAGGYVAICIWLLFPTSSVNWSLKVVAAVATALLVSTAAYFISRRLFFRASYLFRPALESLGQELSSLEDPVAIEATVRQRIAEVCPHAEVRLASWAEFAETPGLEETLERLREGRPAWLTTDPFQRARLLPIGRPNGGPILIVTQKAGLALHTTEDIALMDAMVVTASLALKSAQALRESTTLRRVGVESALQDKELTLNTLFAEVAHELAYPLSYFRFILTRASGGTALSKEDFEIGHDEIARLERMLKNLRARKEPTVELKPVSVVEAAERAVELIRADPRFSALFDIRVPEDIAVRASRDELLQLLANLIRNAAGASPPGSPVVIRAKRTALGVSLDIVDRGAGVPEGLREKIFSSWVSATEGGSGLGLTTCQRITLRFGWSLDYERKDGTSIFRVSVPISAVVRSQEEEAWKS